MKDVHDVGTVCGASGFLHMVPSIAAMLVLDLETPISLGRASGLSWIFCLRPFSL